MEQQKQLHAQAYAPWTEEEENLLIYNLKAGKTIADIADLLGRNKGAIYSRIKKLGISLDDAEETQDTSWFNDYESKLDKLLSEKVEIEEKIRKLRSDILSQMEEHQIERIESDKFSVNYYPARTIMQFDSKTFKAENIEAYTSYCVPRQKEASIVVRRYNND